MVRLTDCPDMTLDVYRGRKTTTQPQQQQSRNKWIKSAVMDKERNRELNLFAVRGFFFFLFVFILNFKALYRE